MRRLRFALGSTPLLPLLAGASFGACSTEPVRLGLVMHTPQGLLDDASLVQLWVFPASLATCGEDGHVSEIPIDSSEYFVMENAGCPRGVSWCKDIRLDRDDTEKMFAVIATDAGVRLAEGCAVARIDQDPLEVSIKVQRYNPPACCNDGRLQAGEQCDFGVQAPETCAGTPGDICQGIVADDVCSCDCTAKEILLSIDDTISPMLTNLPPRSKRQLSMAFAPGNRKINNALRAVYQNETPGAVNKADIAVRFLSKDLYPIQDPYPLSQQLLLPLGCGSALGSGIVQTQTSPSITTIGEELTGIVYDSDQEVPNAFDVWLVVHSTDGCRDECRPTDTACLARQTPIRLSDRSEPPGTSDPDVAGGPEDSALAVWTRGGRVLGRIWKASGELTPKDAELEIATRGTRPRVAGWAQGWMVVYQGNDSDAGGIFLKRVTASGEVSPEQAVNRQESGPQDQPDIAALPDGRALVAWRSDADIYFQRYQADGARVDEDQALPLNTTAEGDQASPAVAASVGVGDFFAIAWENVDTGAIGARLVGGSEGFLYNSDSGKNDDFVASREDIQGVRRLPAVAIGGGGYIAIGWQDDSDDHPGMYVRRFPLPPAR